MLRALIQVAPRETAADGLAPSVRELRTQAELPAVGERAYVIGAVPGGPGGALGAKAVEVDEATRLRFPFRRPSGPRSPQLGPVLKRTLDPKKGIGPNATTVAATLAHFERIALSGEPAAPVYRRALDAAGPGDLEEASRRAAGDAGGRSARGSRAAPGRGSSGP